METGPMKMKKHKIDINQLSTHMKAHYEKEDETLKVLLRLENEFRDYHELNAIEVKQQKELIDRLWVLSQRYLILVSTGACCKYPEIYSGPAEEVILHEYNEKLKQLRSSGVRLMSSLNSLRAVCRIFEKVCSELDMTVESPFILGDTFHKPIGFFIELISDLFKYFHTVVLKFKYRSHQLDPSDSQALEDYKQLLEPVEEFEEYFDVGLTYCKCLRPKPPC